eukprot:4908819-Amphidinium_carterae.1
MQFLEEFAASKRSYLSTVTLEVRSNMMQLSYPTHGQHCEWGFRRSCNVTLMRMGQHGRMRVPSMLL